MKEYYTYAYLRENGTPYYIGMGHGNRINSRHNRKQGLVPLPPEEKRIYLKKDISKEEALKHEIYMISVFGRKDLNSGCLINLTDGGDNPPSAKGKKLTDDHKKKLSQAHKGKPKKYEPWNKGKKLGSKYRNNEERKAAHRERNRVWMRNYRNKK